MISEQKLPIMLVKNDYNITQHLIRTTNFLAVIAALPMDLRNDGRIEWQFLWMARN